MTAKLEQDLQMPPGYARLHVEDVPRMDAATVEVSIARLGASGLPRYLNPGRAGDPWTTAAHHLGLAVVAGAGGAVDLSLDPSITVHLISRQPYLLHLRDGAGNTHEDRFIAIPLRGQGIAPKSETISTPPPVALAQKPAEPLVETIAPVFDPTPLPAQAPPTRRRPNRLPLLVGAGVTLSAAIASLLWFFLFHAPTALPSAAATPITIEEARRLLSTDPAAEEALEAGRRHAEQGELNGAFLLYRHAAERGSMAAAVALAGMYDPATHTARSSPLPAPNPAEAVRWYEPAAQAGDSEAQYRLGILLKRGLTADEAGPEKGVVWLQRAAAQGHSEAAAELEK